MKTYVYGDSFSNNSMCKCDPSEMWYAPFVKGDLVDRTRIGSSTDEAFLLMHHDAICDPDARFLFGTGAMYSRLTKYTDGLYENEKVKEHNTIEDCLAFFDTHRFREHNEDAVKVMHTDMFHHTLVWTRYLTQVILTASLLPPSSWLVVHMHCDREEWQSPHHPMVKPLLQRINGIPNYIDHQHSCFSLCKEYGIRAVDWDEYGEHGHQGPEGQRAFRDHIKQIIDKKTLWN